MKLVMANYAKNYDSTAIYQSPLEFTDLPVSACSVEGTPKMKRCCVIKQDKGLRASAA